MRDADESQRIKLSSMIVDSETRKMRATDAR